MAVRQLVIQANLAPASRMSAGAIGGLMAAYLFFVIAWISGLLLRFRKSPKGSALRGKNASGNSPILPRQSCETAASRVQ
jgi:hypothetical protein